MLATFPTWPKPLGDGRRSASSDPRARDSTRLQSPPSWSPSGSSSVGKVVARGALFAGRCLLRSGPFSPAGQSPRQADVCGHGSGYLALHGALRRGVGPSSRTRGARCRGVGGRGSRGGMEEIALTSQRLFSALFADNPPPTSICRNLIEPHPRIRDMGADQHQQPLSPSAGLKPTAGPVRRILLFGSPKREGQQDETRRNTGGEAYSGCSTPRPN